MRLTNGNNGLLEVYYDGEWGYVCDDGWTEINGDVVCSILGYVMVLPLAVGNSLLNHANTTN